MARGRGQSVPVAQCHVPAAARPQAPARVDPPPRPMGMAGSLSLLTRRQPSPADESETRASAMAL